MNGDVLIECKNEYIKLINMSANKKPIKLLNLHSSESCPKLRNLPKISTSLSIQSNDGINELK